MKNRKRRIEEIEAVVRKTGEEEMAELKLPESMKAENMKSKILEYERQKAKEEGESAGTDEGVRTAAAEGKERRSRKAGRKKAGIAVCAAAAVLMLLVAGTGKFLLPDGEFAESAIEGEEESELVSDDLQTEAETESGSGRIEQAKIDGITQVDSYAELFAFCQAAGMAPKNSDIVYDESMTDSGISKDEQYVKDEAKNPTPTESIEEKATGDADFSDTNVQVEGVDEADIIKTDGTHIIRLSADKAAIQIYRTDGELVEKLPEINLPEAQGEEICSYVELLLGKGYLAVIGDIMERDEESYLSDKMSNAWVGEPGYSRKRKTVLLIYDITEPAKPELLATREQEGSYQSVRMVDGIIYLISHKANSSYYICDGVEEIELAEEWARGTVPKVDGKQLGCNQIYLPEKPQIPDYIVLTSTDMYNPQEHLDSVAIMGDAARLYASKENLYLWQTEWEWDADQEESSCVTTIMKYAYKDGYFQGAGVGKVDGYLNNSFSMDEYNGYLRVVTTADGVREATSVIENQLYVLDASMQIVGSIENLAEGERVKSARFFGEIGYFVTFRQTDPLFSVDLSNPYAPVIIGELKIPGFSSYLHPYGKGLLLGLGQEADTTTGNEEGLKLSMFDVSNPAEVKEVAKLIVREGCNYSGSEAEYNHREVLISPERNIIGFSHISDRWDSNGESDFKYEYSTFSYSPESGFFEEITHDLGEWEKHYGSRGIYIGDYLYIVYPNEQIAIYNLISKKACGKYDFR